MGQGVERWAVKWLRIVFLLGVLVTIAVAQPIRLTAPDGTGLRLVKLDGQARLQGPLAFTQLHLTFANPTNTTLEGKFEMFLPEGASVSRLALFENGAWQEAEIVERARARSVFEEFRRRGRDPILLEQQAGNLFGARIFPIAGQARKEVLLSYSQPLSQDYVLPLVGLPMVDELSLQANVEGGEHQSLKLRNETPAEDWRFPAPPGVVGLCSGTFVILRLPQPEARQPEDLTNALVLVDTSASRHSCLTAQCQAVSQVLRDFPGARVAAFDQDVVDLGSSSEFVQQALLGRGAAGSTDFRAALAWAGRQRGKNRLILISDGVGADGLEDLEGPLRRAGFKRLDALLVGSWRDQAGLEPLVASLGGQVVHSPGELTRRPGLPEGPFRLHGARWAWQAGGLVCAEMSRPPGEIVLDSGRRVALQNAPLPWVERAVVQARLAQFAVQLRQNRDPGQRLHLGQQMVTLSLRHRVLCELTALLALETEDDYVRFGLDRTALRDILVLRENGLEVKHYRELRVVPEGRSVERAGETAPPALVKRPEVETQSREIVASGPRTPANCCRQEILLEYAPAGPVIEFLQTKYPQVEFILHPTMNGFYLVGTRVDVLSIKNDVPNLDHIPPDEHCWFPFIRQKPSSKYTPLPQPPPVLPLRDEMLTIDGLWRANRWLEAEQLARQWVARDFRNPMAWMALGRSLHLGGRPGEARRAYGSILDLNPGRADLCRLGGSLLDTLGGPALPISQRAFAQAVRLRPDQSAGHHLLAFALVRQERLSEAFEALEFGLRACPGSQVLGDDLALLAAVRVARQPQQRPILAERLRWHRLTMTESPSRRLVMTHDGNEEVEVSVRDKSDGDYYGDRWREFEPSILYLGQPAGPSSLWVSQYRSESTLGKVEIIHHDGRGHLKFQEIPFALMQSGHLELGELEF